MIIYISKPIDIVGHSSISRIVYQYTHMPYSAIHLRSNFLSGLNGHSLIAVKVKGAFVSQSRQARERTHAISCFFEEK